MADEARAREAPRVPGKRVTSADVARAAGVSRATVSYVLNDVPGRMISASTRELVLRTARELGHVPFAPARSLRLGRSNIVLALVRDFSLGYVSNTLLRRLDVALAERGYVMLAHHYDASLRPVSELWQLVSPTLVVAMGGISMSDQSLIEHTSAKVLRVHGTLPNSTVGSMQARHLAQRGHVRIGYASPSDPSLALIAGERLRGAQEACADLGLAEPLVCTVDPTRPDSILEALDTWAAGDGVTAVAAHNDEIALLIASGLAARGQVAGRDLAIIGVDNIPSARLSLTTVEIDAERWGDAVAASVLSLLDGGEELPIPTDLLRLIERETA